MNTSVDQFVKEGQDFAGQTAEQAQDLGRRGMAAARDTAQHALDAASDVADSMIGYTRKNPATALLIAAASGAVLLALLKALSPSRD